MGFESNGKWRSTFGWAEKIIQGGVHTEILQVGPSYSYTVGGIMGEIVETQFPIVSSTGTKLGTSDLAFKFFRVVGGTRLAMRVIPITVTTPDGRTMLTDDWEGMVSAAGFPVTIESARNYYRSLLVEGKQVEIAFFDNTQGVEQARERYKSIFNGSPVDPNSIHGQMYALCEASLTNVPSLVQELENGENSGQIVIPNGFTSSLYFPLKRNLNLP